jgi:DNA-binding ferritin-like protein
MDKCSKISALYIATLKAISLVHQHNHWTTKGKTFYGDHLLFERLYNSALENLDLAAEKFMGLFGADCLHFTLQADLLYKILLKYKGLEGKPLVMSLTVEKDFIKLSSDAYKCFEDEDRLTLGLDDMIMAIASKREESVYLLQQPLKGIASKSNLGKMAGSPQTDPVIEYLMRAIPVAAANANINNVVVSKVEVIPSASVGKVQLEDTYMAYIVGIPAQQAQTFKNTWDKQLAAQKPNLIGHVGFSFQD